MLTKFEEVIIGESIEFFLHNLQEAILIGYRIKEIPFNFGMGVWSCTVYRHYKIVEAEKSKKVDVEFRLEPPYIVSELRIASWTSILKLCKQFYVSSHGGRNVVIDRIIQSQKDMANGIEPNLQKAARRASKREYFNERKRNCTVSGS